MSLVVEDFMECSFDGIHVVDRHMLDDLDGRVRLAGVKAFLPFFWIFRLPYLAQPGTTVLDYDITAT